MNNSLYTCNVFSNLSLQIKNFTRGGGQTAAGPIPAAEAEPNGWDWDQGRGAEIGAGVRPQGSWHVLTLSVWTPRIVIKQGEKFDHWGLDSEDSLGGSGRSYL